MVDRSQNSSLALRKETVSGTYNAPSAGDEIVISDLNITPQPVTYDANEFTGTIHRPGAQLVGETIEVSGKALLRGPGGTVIPAADAYVTGRIMQAAGFSEVRVATPIPVAAEAGSGGTTTALTLGAGATGTADLYRAFLIDLVSAGAGLRPKRFSMIQEYSAAKLATLAETLGSAYVGNYQLPSQLIYQLSPGASPPTLSMIGNAGGKRYSMAGMAPTSFRINLPTASRDQQEPPSIEFTFSGKIVDVADEAPLVVDPAISAPPFRDGKMFVNRVPLGGSSLVIDLNAETAFPPNANELDGYETGLLVRTTRTVSMTLNQVADSVINLRTLAKNQGYVPILGMWGVGSGNFFGAIVTHARLFTPAPDISGPFVTAQLEAAIDGANKHISLAIPFYA
jgi:hypothetical protein